MAEKKIVNELFATVAGKARAGGQRLGLLFGTARGAGVGGDGTAPSIFGVWQLVINTGTIITFLMVFLIHAQNKDMRAVHLKLNELIAAVEVPATA